MTAPPLAPLSERRLHATAEDRRIAALAAAAVGLSLAEAAIPSPLPGVKAGLANIVTLLVLYQYGWRVALWVTLLRVVASALALGMFLTPTFVLSLAGALASLAVLAPLAHLPMQWIGPAGLSMLAAAAHLLGQLVVVDLWLLPGIALAPLIPPLAIAAGLTGLFNGLVVAKLLRQGTGPATGATS